MDEIQRKHCHAPRCLTFIKCANNKSSSKKKGPMKIGPFLCHILKNNSVSDYFFLPISSIRTSSLYVSQASLPSDRRPQPYLR